MTSKEFKDLLIGKITRLVEQGYIIKDNFPESMDIDKISARFDHNDKGCEMYITIDGTYAVPESAMDADYNTNMEEVYEFMCGIIREQCINYLKS